MKLYLHIGWPKTGTSSIQDFCDRNREVLLNDGLLYPRSFVQGVGHHLIPTALMRADQKAGRRDLPDTNNLSLSRIHKDISTELAELDNIECVVVSSERFMTLDSEQIAAIRNMFSDFEIKVIFYLRRQDLFAQSIYAQNLRVLRPVKPDDVLRHRILQYRTDLTPWEAEFDPEDMTLVPFEKSQWQSGLERDFIRHVGIEPKAKYEIEPPSNERLSWDALTYLNDYLNPQFGSERYWQAIVLLEKFSRRFPTKPAQLNPFSPETRHALMQQCEDDNAYLSARYLNGKSLFQDPLPDIDEAWEPYPGISPFEKRRLDAYFLRRA